MIELKTKLRHYGNSFRIIIPPKIIKNLGLKEGEEVTILFGMPKVNLRKMFGSHKFHKPIQKLMTEMDNELYNN